MSDSYFDSSAGAVPPAGSDGVWVLGFVKASRLKPAERRVLSEAPRFGGSFVIVCWALVDDASLER